MGNSAPLTLADYRAALDAATAADISARIAAAARLAQKAYAADPSPEKREAMIARTATDCAVAFWEKHGEPWRA